MTQAPILLWFRRDLRLTDQAAVAAAVRCGRPCVPVFVLDDGADGLRQPGAASEWWLDKSLQALAGELERRGSRLIVRRGPSRAVLPALAREVGAGAAVWGRSYEPGARARDAAVRAALDGLAVEETDGSFLVQPGSVRNGSGEAYRVFTPWWRAAQKGLGDVRPSPAPTSLRPPTHWPASLPRGEWRLHPTKPDWSGGFAWTAGEAAALARLDSFMASGADRYHVTRDLPAEAGSTRLSPHLTWGEIGARQIYAAAQDAAIGHEARDKLLSEVAWRDFNWQLLTTYPEVADTPFRREFSALPTRDAPEDLEAWRRGLTGYPIVDAGMRELWATGWMPNRLRLIAGSFLVKHLMIDWREGERFFWDTLIDADPANNPLNWQWIAGSGPDAQPFNRIFNPLLQAEKFDGRAEYVRRWVPELGDLPDATAHQPWTAAELPAGYPPPVVEHGFARERALRAFQAVRTSTMRNEA